MPHYTNESPLPTGYVYFFKGNVLFKYDNNFKHVISSGPVNDLLECKAEADNEVLLKGK